MGLLQRLFGRASASSRGSTEPPPASLSVAEAVTSGDIGKVMESIRLNHSVNARDTGGGTPLIIAASTGNRAIAELLLAHRADIDARESGTGKTALIYAIEQGHLETAELLLRCGAGINTVDNQGNTALMFSNSETAPLLIRNGADLNTVNGFGYTPLKFFRERGWESMIVMLEAAGAR